MFRRKAKPFEYHRDVPRLITQMTNEHLSLNIRSQAAAQMLERVHMMLVDAAYWETRALELLKSGECEWMASLH